MIYQPPNGRWMFQGQVGALDHAFALRLCTGSCIQCRVRSCDSLRPFALGSRFPGRVGFVGTGQFVRTPRSPPPSPAQGVRRCRLHRLPLRCSTSSSGWPPPPSPLSAPWRVTTLGHWVGARAVGAASALLHVFLTGLTAPTSPPQYCV